MANSRETVWTASPAVGSSNIWTPAGGPVASLHGVIQHRIVRRRPVFDLPIVADEPTREEKLMTGVSRVAGVAALGAGILGMMALITPLI
jgi:hypothetical protein